MTASGKPAQILDALCTHVGTLETGTPTLPVAYPEVHFDPAVSATDGKYLAVSFFPNRPAWEGVTAGVMDQGLLQISVVWPKDQGLVAPNEIADLVKAHFAKGTLMISGSTQVKVSAEPWVAQHLAEDSEIRVPVTISWTA